MSIFIGSGAHVRVGKFVSSFINKKTGGAFVVALFAFSLLFVPAGVAEASGCNNLLFSSSPSTVVTGQVTTVFTVAASDSFFVSNCTLSSAPDAVVTLSDGAANGTFYSDAAGTIPVTTVTLSNVGGSDTSHSASFYYKDTVTGNRTLTAAVSFDSTDPTEVLNVTPVMDGSGTMTVAPSSVLSASTNNDFVFHFTNNSGGNFSDSSDLTITIPAGWTNPQETTSGNAGYVTVSSSTCGNDPENGNNDVSVSSNVVTVNIDDCDNGDSFDLRYENLTAPVASAYTFTTATRDGSSGTTNIAVSPVVTVTAPDAIAPVISQVTAVPTPTNDSTPSYTFSTDEAGSVVVGGSCSIPATNAVVGNNTITFNSLANGTYANCTVAVKDASNNTSNVLSVPEFVINTDIFNQGFVTFSFDDGWQSILDNAIPLLDAAGYKSTQYIYSDAMNQVHGDIYMNETEVLSMKTSGHDIAAHSRTHTVALSASTPADVLQHEVDGSRFDLITSMGVPVDNYAYTFGDGYDAPSVIARLQAAGFSGGRSTQEGFNDQSTDRYALKIFEVTDTTTLAEMIAEVNTAVATKTWLIFMFHQVEDTVCPATAEYDYCTTTENIDGLVDHIQTSSASVITVSQGLAMMPSAPASSAVAPVIAQPSNMTLNASSLSGMPVVYSAPLVTDDIDSTLGSFCLPASGSTFGLGTTTVTCTAADTSGNLAVSKTFDIGVVDTAPVIAAHDPVSADATSPAGATVNYTLPSVTDNIDVGLIASCLPASGSVFPLGPTIVTCNAGPDASGNNATPTTFTVTVTDGAPVITLTGDAEVSVEYGFTYTDAGATALDAVDGNLTGSIVTVNPVNTLVLGDYTVTYNVSDSALNAAVQVIRTVHVVAKAITVSATVGQNKVYGAVDPVFTYSATPLVGLDVFTGELSRVAGEAVGTYAITQGTLTAGSNYTLTFVSSDFAITAAGTATVITNDVALATPTVTGEFYTVAWSVTPISGVAAPTGTVTVTVNGGTGCSANVENGSCIVSDSVATLVGTYSLVATYSGDSTYTGSTSSAVSHTVDKAGVSVAITNEVELSTPTLVNGSYAVKWGVSVQGPGAGTPTGTVTVTGGSECTADVSAGQCDVTSTEAGLKTLIATYNGDANFNSNVSGGVSHTVNPADQTITFDPLANKATNATPFALTASASSGLPVSFSIISGPATVDADTLTITGAGTVTVRASQAGNANYNPAVDVDQSFLVTVAPEVVIDSAPASFINTADTAVTFHVTGDYTTLVCELDSTPIACESAVELVLSALSETPHSLSITATDALSNSDVETISFTVDITAPTVLLSTTASNPTNISPIPVTVTFSEPVTGFDSSDISVSNGTIGNFAGSDAVYTFDITPDNAGPFTVTADVAYGVATDVALNPNGQATQLAMPYDAVAPTLTVDAPVINATAITGTTDIDATVVVTIDGNNYDADGEETGTWTITTPVLVDGSYPISVQATDALVNTTVNTSRTLIVDTTAPVITVDGDDPQVIEVGSEYIELGATVTDALDASPVLTISTTTVNTGVVGSYTVTYDAIDAAGNTAVQKTRTVNVVDTQAPVITILGANPQIIVVTNAYVELGADVSDNYDSGLVATIDASAVNTSALGTYSVLYSVTDASLNSTSTTRTVNVVDSLPPVITLTGSSVVTLHVGDTYTDAGATALDDVNGDLTGSIVIGGDTVATSTMGSYVITYNVSDLSGNAAVQVTRTVNVVPVIGSEAATTATTNSITITWTTDHGATSRVIYDTVSHDPVTGSAPNYGYAFSTVEDSATTTVHSVTVSGLSVGTIYFLRPVSHGSPETVGNEVTKETQNAPTAAAAPAGGGGGGGGGGGFTQVASLKINNGATQTNVATVTLTLAAPSAANQMWISNDASFADGAWTTLTNTVSWTLTSGSGVKTVFVRYGLGNSVIATASAGIELSGAGTQGQVLGAAAFNFTRTLSLGSRGADVTELQKILTAEGVYTGPITGYFGPLTQAAVKAYQTKHGLDPVGIVGPKTRVALNAGNGTVAGASTVNTDALLAQLQALLAQVAKLQAELKAMQGN